MRPQIDKLLAFKQKDKFSPQAWNERGLNPSTDELCKKLTNLFNECADNLIIAVNKNVSIKQLKSVLKKALSNFNQLDYDTEEKEFICDLFYELSTIVNVDFNDNISKWLYGGALTNLLKLQKLINPKKIIETRKQACTKCGIELETYIITKEKGIPETSWLVAKCNNCSELNLLSNGPDVKEARFGNYQWIDTIGMNEYTFEQALTRLEQIKFFRK